jgi:hypothetical protein
MPGKGKTKIGLNPNYGELYAEAENYRIAGKQESCKTMRTQPHNYDAVYGGWRYDPPHGGGMCSAAAGSGACR